MSQYCGSSIASPSASRAHSQRTAPAGKDDLVGRRGLGLGARSSDARRQSESVRSDLEQRP